jgi:hypothetical protein
MPTMPDAVIVFQEKLLFQESIKCRRSCNFRFRNVSNSLRLNWTSEED